MSAAARKASHSQRVLKIGEIYFDRSRGVMVTLEDFEVTDGRRSGRLVVCAADGVLRFPRRWYCREPDLVAPPEPQGARGGGGGTRS